MLAIGDVSVWSSIRIPAIEPFWLRFSKEWAKAQALSNIDLRNLSLNACNACIFPKSCFDIAVRLGAKSKNYGETVGYRVHVSSPQARLASHSVWRALDEQAKPAVQQGV
ncbi:hypothetical protein GCM10007385_27010 [Tateyamaria omphalii]|nr:hypothetical protein GCM10007385_27010 [Tateyamaria omphalii]